MEIAEFFYTEGEAAKLLCVSRITIWKWIKADKFSIQRVGREVLIPKWEVDLLRARKTNSRVLSNVAKHN